MRFIEASLPVALALGILTALLAPVACKRPGQNFGERCDPSAANRCLCCSDDPLAIDVADIEAFVIPTFVNDEDWNIPIFSGRNNSRSRSGLCSSYRPNDATQVQVTADLTLTCPAPCNPTWSDVDIAAACGGGVCCPTGRIEPEDCVFHDSLGSSGCWRPATGGDIVGLGGLEATDWAADAHATHQDPGGIECQAFAEGIDETTLAVYGLTTEALRQACLRRLTVLNQRGLCVDDINQCPVFDATQPDACEQLNLAEQLAGC